MPLINELLDRGERDEARAQAEKTVAQKPTDGEALSALARLALEAGEVEVAQRHLARVLPRERELYEVKLCEAMVLQLSGKPDAARLAFAELTAQHPRRPEGFFSLGVSLLEKEDGKGAEKALATAVQLQPKHFFYRYRHAEALAQVGRMAEAAEALIKCIEWKPDFVPGYLAFARLLEGTGQPDKAFEILEAGLASMPTERRLMAELTRLKLGTGEVEAAYAQAEKAEGGALGLAEELMRGNAHNAALAICEELDKRGKGSAKVTLLKGVAHEGAGRTDEALAAYATAMKQDPSDWSAANNRGLLLLETAGDDAAKLAEAKSNLDEAVSRARGKVPDPLLNLALWYGRQEQWAEGIATAQQVASHPSAGALKSQAEKMVTSMQAAKKA